MAPKAKSRKDEDLEHNGGGNQGGDVAVMDGEPEEEDPENNIERDNENRFLKCLLLSEERIEVAEALTNAMYERENKQSEFDSIKKQYNSELSAMDEGIKAKQRLVHDGYQMRYITCEIIRDYNTKTFRAVRTDTGEIIEERPLRSHELQRTLFKDSVDSEMDEHYEAAADV